MPCDSTLREGQTLADRMAEVDRALKKLQAALGSGIARVEVRGNGAVTFAGWQDRAGVNDACAYRTLAAQGSWELRRAVARAEALAGRKVDARAAASGLHSHDGGKTWAKH